MAKAAVKTYKEQTFDHLKGLDGISDGQIAEHLSLYAGYVKQVNTLNEMLAELRGHGKASGKSPEFAELTRRLGFEYNGMILHEYYFSNLRRAGEPTPPPPIRAEFANSRQPGAPALPRGRCPPRDAWSPRSPRSRSGRRCDRRCRRRCACPGSCASRRAVT